MALEKIKHRLSLNGSSSFTLEIDNLSIARGSKSVILGKNGSGKSSLSRILAFIEKPVSGKIFFNEKEVKTAREAEIARKRVSLMLQQPVKFSGSVYNSLRMVASFRKVALEELDRKIRSFGLKDLVSRHTTELSTGELRRVQLAMASLGNPELLILDEPTSYLDEKTRKEFLNYLENLIEDGLSESLVYITHRLDEALRIGDHYIFMEDGMVKAAGELENILEDEKGFEALFGSFSAVKGKATDVGQSIVTVSTDSGIKLQAISEDHMKPGDYAYILIRNDSIVLSTENPHSSSQNTFEALISSFEESGDCVKAKFAAPFRFSALITKKSFLDLGLGSGKKCYVSFKATSARAYRTSGRKGVVV